MFNSRVFCYVLASLVLFGHVHGQFDLPGVGSPHNYPGKPRGDYNPAWQKYFEVTIPLPNVTWPLPRNWAGNIAVNRHGHPNDTLFFWGFEKEFGSLTAAAGDRDDEPWGIWLNGGPGSSSMVGMFFENGPIHIADDYSLYSNPYAWSKLADYIWVDQPVGVGFSTVDNTGFVADEDQMGEDFMGFLSNLVKVYPSLRHRPLHLTGESYAGTYIPYIVKAYFGMKNPPVKIAKIAIGDGSLGNDWVDEILPAVTVLQTYPQLIGYDPDVFNYFREQSHLCGFDLNFTYPQHGHFPTISPSFPPVDGVEKRRTKMKLVEQAIKIDALAAQSRKEARSLGAGSERVLKREQWKRDLSGRPNGTIDPWYGCDLLDEVIDYALNFSLPWGGNDFDGFDVYNIPDALEPEAPMDASIFLNNNVTRAAIHAPTNKDWAESIFYSFGSQLQNDPSVEPMAFLSELATNASHHNVKVVLFSGNDDSLVSHKSTEVAIQNTTFGGIQGFTRKPSTHWFDDEGEFAGIVHQERDWTYVLVKGAGHLVSQQQPQRALVFLREFVLGNNSTGLVTKSHGHATVVGGEDKNFNGILSGQLGIYTGSETTQGTYTFPSATIAVWETFIATAVRPSPTSADAHVAARTAL